MFIFMISQKNEEIESVYIYETSSQFFFLHKTLMGYSVIYIGSQSGKKK
jgi:hypothetical protein